MSSFCIPLKFIFKLKLNLRFILFFRKFLVFENEYLPKWEKLHSFSKGNTKCRECTPC